MCCQTNGEVVELVYGTSLENWRRFVAYRGFESHPLRQATYKNGESYEIKYDFIFFTFIL